ncbi:MAG: serine hydrolase [Saprospiraceae bacterium]|nr:serine hydrolase [Saprospiraceae bacterium]
MKNSFILMLVMLLGAAAQAQPQDPLTQLSGFDQYMEQLLQNWNAPGVGVGVVVKGKLVFVKGYGYRDYDKKTPITGNTLFQIASNSKLFTAVAVGMEVENGKLEWDKPIKKFVPTIEFYNDELNNSVTMRDMLSHRTGISRHDLIWFKSEFSRKQLFDKLKYLEPSQPLRQGFIYNNLMYTAAGYSIELLTGKTWEEYLQANILNPLDMKSTVFTIADMRKSSDYFTPYDEKRDTNILHPIPWYEEQGGVGPAGAVISNINDMSHWLVALMNDGKYKDKQVIPSAVLQATLQPSIPTGNSITAKYKEMQNPVYGMGRWVSSYRGHLYTEHGGALDGIYSQVSFMPQDSIGVIVFAIGDHCRPLIEIVNFNVYERLLGLDQTPWKERRLKEYLEGKKIRREARQKASVGRIAGTKPSHPMDDYVGEYEHPAYGIIKITKKGEDMQFALNKIQLPLSHFHYDRFDTPNDERLGLYSLNFTTNPQGDIGSLTVSLDESEAIFKRRPDASLSDPATLETYTGQYEIGGSVLTVALKNNELIVSFPGTPDTHLVPYKSHVFKAKEFSDMTIEFVMGNGKATAMKQKDPSGEYVMKRKG